MEFTAQETELIIAALSIMQESDEENGHADLAKATRALIDRFQVGDDGAGDQESAYRVNLHEERGDKHTIIFECQAEDDDDAAQQALNAYPAGEVVHTVKVTD